MSKGKRTVFDWAALAALSGLMAVNGALGLLLRTGGPLIGLACYGALLVVAWRSQGDSWHTLAIGSIVGLLLHVVEVIVWGWSEQAILMGLNLLLPAVLAILAWLAGRQRRRAS